MDVGKNVRHVVDDVTVLIISIGIVINNILLITLNISIFLLIGNLCKFQPTSNQEVVELIEHTLSKLLFFFSRNQT